MSISELGAMGDGVEMTEKEPRSEGRQLLHDFGDPQYCPLSPETDHNCDIPEGRFAFPSPVRGHDQLKALLRRQYLHKKRGWQQTVMEIVSPLLLLTLLVWGYSRSVEEHFHAETFVNQTLPLPSLLKQELLSNSKSLLQLCPPSLLAQQRLSVEELGVLVELMRQEVAQGLGEASAFRNLARNLTHSNTLLPSESPLGALSLKCMESAMQVSNVITTFNAYNGPLPVPSFDAFVQVHKLLQRTLKSGNGQQYEDALRAQRMFGNLVGFDKETLGILLQLGCITFAPGTPEVTALVEYLSNSTEFFKDIYGGTFRTEQVGLSPLLLAVIAFYYMWSWLKGDEKCLISTGELTAL